MIVARAYNSLRAKRDWVLAKIEYLNSESAKWRTGFNLAKSPWSLLRAMGLSPQLAATVLIGGSVAGGGVVVNETLLDGPSFSRGSPGVYDAPGDAPVFYDGADNTLRLDLSIVPVGEITIQNVTIGDILEGSDLPAGETDVLFLGGLPATGTHEETFLEIGHLTIDRWRCTQLELSDIEAYELNIKFNASDGQSIAPTPGTPRNRAVGGGNRADSMTTSGGYYDQIKIQAPHSGVDGRVDVMRLSNIQSRGGPCTLSRLKVGTLDVFFNIVGAGDGFAAKDLVVESSVVCKICNVSDNVEIIVEP
jgi:hypothetical protein